MNSYVVLRGTTAALVLILCSISVSATQISKPGLEHVGKMNCRATDDEKNTRPNDPITAVGFECVFQPSKKPADRYRFAAKILGNPGLATQDVNWTVMSFIGAVEARALEGDYDIMNTVYFEPISQQGTLFGGRKDGIALRLETSHQYRFSPSTRFTLILADKIEEGQSG